MISFFKSFGRILQAFLVGLLVGFSFWDVGNSTSDIALIQLSIFMALVLGMLKNYNFFIKIFNIDTYLQELCLCMEPSHNFSI